MAESAADPYAWIAQLPVPVDDGGARHLLGAQLPLPSLVDVRSGAACNLATLADRLVMFVYPATGVPGRDPAIDPAPGWDDIPGAPGCTAQSVGYRDAHAQFRERGFAVVSVSAQPQEEQAEFARRQQIDFPVLNDSAFALADALGLPTFVVEQRRFYRRIALVIVEGRIVHVNYPVFPPHRNAEQVLSWIDANAR